MVTLSLEGHSCKVRVAAEHSQPGHHWKGMSVTSTGENPVCVKTDLALCLPRNPHPSPAPDELPTGSPLARGCASCRASFMGVYKDPALRLMLCCHFEMISEQMALHFPFSLGPAHDAGMVLTSGAPGTQNPLGAPLCLCPRWAWAYVTTGPWDVKQLNCCTRLLDMEPSASLGSMFT